MTNKRNWQRRYHQRRRAQQEPQIDLHALGIWMKEAVVSFAEALRTIAGTGRSTDGE